MAALLVYEHVLIRPDDLTRVNIAFFNVNVVISVGLLLVSVVDILVLMKLRSWSASKASLPTSLVLAVQSG